MKRIFRNSLLFACLTAVPSALFGAPVVSLLATPDPIRNGQELTVDVHVYDVTDLAAWQFDLYYDPSVLLFNSVANGDVFSSAGLTDFFFEGTDSGGVVAGTFSSVFGPGGVSTLDGWLARVTFLALPKFGPTSLRLDSILLTQSDSMDITPDVLSYNPVSVQVIPEPGACLLAISGAAAMVVLRRLRG